MNSKLLAAVFLLCTPLHCMAGRVEKPPIKSLYVTIFTHDNWESIPVEKRLVENMNTDVFKELRMSSHFNHYTLSSPLFSRKRYGQIDESSLPVILLQKDSGGTVYKASGSSVPSTAKKIYDHLEAANNIAFLLEKEDAVTVSEGASIEGLFDRLRPNKDEEESAEGWFNRENKPIRDTLSSLSYLVGGGLLLMFLFLALCIAAPFAVLITLVILAVFRSK